MRLQPGLQSSEALTGAGGPTSMMVPSYYCHVDTGCCQEDSVLHCVGFSIRRHDMAAGFSQVEHLMKWKGRNRGRTIRER